MNNLCTKLGVKAFFQKQEAQNQRNQGIVRKFLGKEFSYYSLISFKNLWKILLIIGMFSITVILQISHRLVNVRGHFGLINYAWKPKQALIFNHVGYFGGYAFFPARLASLDEFENAVG